MSSSKKPTGCEVIRYGRQDVPSEGPISFTLLTSKRNDLEVNEVMFVYKSSNAHIFVINKDIPFKFSGNVNQSQFVPFVLSTLI